MLFSIRYAPAEPFSLLISLIEGQTMRLLLGLTDDSTPSGALQFFWLLTGPTQHDM
jgi:hypothetical protein